LHVPIVAPLALVQMPPQHSVFVLQMSPVCVQNEGWFEQTPLLQKLEQHSPFVAHVLPEVRQEPLSGVHVPAPPSLAPEHTPPQQLAFEVQALLSEMQSAEPHVPPLQTNVQHSFATLQAVPPVLQVPMGATQILSVRLQLTEQHSALVAHVAPGIEQVPPSVMPLSLPASEPPPSEPPPSSPPSMLVEVVPSLPPHPPMLTAQPTAMVAARTSQLR
jgi:hypothetical protein